MRHERRRIPVRSEPEIAAIREACQVAAAILDRLCQLVRPGVSTYDIELASRDLFRDHGAESPCYHYQPPNHAPFGGYICLSLNDEIVHGCGDMRKVARDGDNLTVDVAVSYRGWIGDNARTVPVGTVDARMQHLLEHTEKALYLGIAEAVPGKRVGNISSRIQKYIEGQGMSIVREFCGHGVGQTMHEEPQVPNFGRPKDGAKLYPGTIIAIEPMVNSGTRKVLIDNDSWTARTADGSPSAHFEHTVLVTHGEPEILTQLPKTVAATA